MAQNSNNADRARSDFNKTTLRLVTEFVKKSGQESTIVNLGSFLDLFRHLNPIAPVPTVPEVEACALERPYYPPTACIICGVEGQEEKTLTLTVDDAAVILTATIHGAGREKTEASNKIYSSSLRVCIWHFDSLFKMMFKSLQIEDSQDVKQSSSEQLLLWSITYKRIKALRERCEDTEFGPKDFKILLQGFMETFYIPSGGSNGSSRSPELPDKEDPQENQIKQEVADDQEEGLADPDPPLQEQIKSEPIEESSMQPPSMAPDVITLPNGRKLMKLPASVSKNLQSSGRLVTYRMKKRVVPGVPAGSESSTSKMARVEPSSEDVEVKKEVVDDQVLPKKEIEDYDQPGS